MWDMLVAYNYQGVIFPYISDRGNRYEIHNSFFITIAFIWLL